MRRRLLNLFDASLYEFVDLGLSVKWATCNLGAENPEDYGMYFAWGETDGYYVTEDEYGSLIIEDKDGVVTDAKSSGFYWPDYTLCDGSETTMAKYCVDSTYGIEDNKTVLEQSDDAAYVSDNTCRMPTRAELEELINGTTSAWTTDYNGSGVKGVILTSKSDTSKSIFLPAAGDVQDGSHYDVGSRGDLWSSSLDEDYPNYAYNVDFYSYSVYSTTFARCNGLSVRPVKDK